MALFGLLRNLLLLIVLITVLRSVIGLIAKAFGNFVSGPSPRPIPRSNAEATPITGELHRDPVCGTFVASSTQFQRAEGKQRFYYCSETCQSQHMLTAR
jgi:hypothetical protein